LNASEEDKVRSKIGILSVSAVTGYLSCDSDVKAKSVARQEFQANGWRLGIESANTNAIDSRRP
jgi:hypothetical protein